MAKKKAAKKVRRKFTSLVVVYEIRDFGVVFMPGSIIRLPVEQLEAWRPYIESRAVIKVSSKKKAEAVAKSVIDGSFELAPSVKHSTKHGGFG